MVGEGCRSSFWYLTICNVQLWNICWRCSCTCCIKTTRFLSTRLKQMKLVKLRGIPPMSNFSQMCRKWVNLWSWTFDHLSTNSASVSWEMISCDEKLRIMIPLKISFVTWLWNMMKEIKVKTITKQIASLIFIACNNENEKVQPKRLSCWSF